MEFQHGRGVHVLTVSPQGVVPCVLSSGVVDLQLGTVRSGSGKRNNSTTSSEAEVETVLLSFLFFSCNLNTAQSLVAKVTFFLAEGGLSERLSGQVLSFL